MQLRLDRSPAIIFIGPNVLRWANRQPVRVRAAFRASFRRPFC